MSADTTTPTVTLCTDWSQPPPSAQDLPGVGPDLNPLPCAPAALNTGARSLFDLAFPSCHDETCLLGPRYLCRGGGMLLVGPTGIGKSACVMQCAISWAIGRPAFGITPAGPLKILIIQAENDDGDLAEMRAGVLAGLGLTEDELELARENVLVVTEDARSGLHFVQLLDDLLATEQPDLVIIDPAFAYLGGSVNDQEAVTTFLRKGVTPLIRKYGCGALIILHTNKPPDGKEKQGWQAGDLAYAGGGSSEFANWARAVITIRSIGRHDVFELNLGKRGGRLGWKEPDGVTPRYKDLDRPLQSPGQIFCQELSAEETVLVQATTEKVNKSPDDLMSLVPATGSVAKNDLILMAPTIGIGRNCAAGFIKVLVTAGRVQEIQVPRPGKKAEVRIARSEQQQEEAPAK